MPPVTKQTPTGAANGRPAQRKGGSILSQAVDVSEAQDDAIHMLLYGKNRVGKSTLACQFPKPLLLVAVEPTKTGGARSVARMPGVKLLRLKDSAGVITLAEELSESNPFQTVVIDSGTSLEEIILAEVCGWDQTANLLRWGRVTMDQYMERSDRVRAALRPYLSLTCHVVIAANEKDHNPPEGRKNALATGPQAESFFAAAMGGATARWLQDGCDYVCQLLVEKETREVKTKVQVGKVMSEEVSRVETGRVIRRLRTQMHPNFAAGIRSPTPDKVPEFVDEPTFAKILKVARGE